MLCMISERFVKRIEIEDEEVKNYDAGCIWQKVSNMSKSSYALLAAGCCWTRSLPTAGFLRGRLDIRIIKFIGEACVTLISQDIETQ